MNKTYSIELRSLVFNNNVLLRFKTLIYNVYFQFIFLAYVLQLKIYPKSYVMLIFSFGSNTFRISKWDFKCDYIKFQISTTG